VIGKDRFLVTAALPYANGKLHVGHIAGAYLPADTYVRFLRLWGKEAIFVCGSDENGAPITVRALQEGVSPQEIVDRYDAILRSSFAELGIEFDIYGRTHTPRHNEVSQQFFLRLLERGYLAKRACDQIYCRTCCMFLPDRYVEGICHWPDCGGAGARGDQCEKCGRPIDATRLLQPKCVVCRQQKRPAGDVIIRTTEHWYFLLDRCADEIRRYLDSHPEWRESVRRFSYGLLEQGLRERAITRDLAWGVPVPLPEAAGKVLYVWFDAPIGYITFTRVLCESRGQPEGWKKFWQDETAGLVHFIGKDNTVFHAVIFPAMLWAHGGYRLPDAVVANEFLNLEGDKISTSRGWAVWVDEYLANFAADPLRYYLTAIAPETSDSDFSWREFQARNNGELADNLGNFIQRNLAFCAKYFDGKMPEASQGLTAGAGLLQEIEDSRREIAEHLANFRFRAGLERLMRLSQRGNQFLAETAPWQMRKRDAAACAAAVHIGLRAVEALSIFMAPFLPFAAANLRRMLRLPAVAPGDWLAEPRLTVGHVFGEPEVLFPKIDDGAIERQMRAL